MGLAFVGYVFFMSLHDDPNVSHALGMFLRLAMVRTWPFEDWRPWDGWSVFSMGRAGKKIPTWTGGNCLPDRKIDYQTMIEQDSVMLLADIVRVPRRLQCVRPTSKFHSAAVNGYSTHAIQPSVRRVCNPIDALTGSTRERSGGMRRAGGKSDLHTAPIEQIWISMRWSHPK
ncbi:hypothetical protein VTK56DRAFT_2609 [Thermocarpiscus australiensis]